MNLVRIPGRAVCLAAVLSALVGSLRAEQPIPLGTRLEPMVDETLLQRMEGASLQVQKPQPREVVLVCDKPWEGNTSAYYAIFQDGPRFRMYYRGAHWDEKNRRAAHREVTCYAESRDGIHWIKPDLGLFEFEGNKANNIVWDGPGAHNFTPFLDENPDCPPQERYKALASGKGGLLAFASADGIHWKLLSEKPVITKGAFDSQNLAFWDPHLGRYREYHRGFREGVRDIMTGTSADFRTWSDPQWLSYGDAPKEHLYTNAVRNYPGAPHVLIGFPTRFLPDTQQVEPIFMVSRDGLNFRRYSEPVVPRTAPENRIGNRSNYMAWGLLRLADEPQHDSVYATEAYYKGPGIRVRRFAYRRDGYVALVAPQRGEVLTRPITFDGKRLVLNFATQKQGHLRAELQTADGQPIAGYTLEDCQPLTGDHLDGVVRWKGSEDLSALAGKPVRLRLVLEAGQLYTLQFAR